MSWVDDLAEQIHGNKQLTVQQIKKLIHRAISRDMGTAKNASAGRDMLISAGVSSQTKEPFVMIESDDLDHPIQIDPESARNLAMLLLEARENSLSDAAIVGFFEKKIGMNDRATSGVLVELREWRNKRDTNLHTGRKT